MRSTGNRYRTTAIRAPATKALAVVGSVAAVLQVAFWLLQTPQQRDAYSWQMVCGFSWPRFQEGRWWALFTYVLVQGGVLHWLAVMLGLYVFGRSVEPIIGSSHVLVASGLGTAVGGLVHGMACQYGALPTGQALWGALPAVLALVGVYSTVLP
ncbi:MAG: rhomboid family intramembrane serine protease, partial [Verrucomicrobiota bacterium]